MAWAQYPVEQEENPKVRIAWLVKVSGGGIKVLTFPFNYLKSELRNDQLYWELWEFSASILSLIIKEILLLLSC